MRLVRPTFLQTVEILNENYIPQGEITLVENALADDAFEKTRTISTNRWGDKKECYRIHGPFIEMNTMNINRRYYGEEIVMPEVERYIRERIAINHAVGELDHPMDRVDVWLQGGSHIIEKFERQGNLIYGTARIIPTPRGRIVMVYIDEDILLGVSTRATGSLDAQRHVRPDFKLKTVDIVHGASGPSCTVKASVDRLDAILGNKDRIISGDEIVHESIQTLEKNLETISVRNFDGIATALNSFISDLGQSVRNQQIARRFTIKQ